MGFNYKIEKQKFKNKWAILRKEYLSVGMDECDVNKLYIYDWEWFKSKRRYVNRTQELPLESVSDNTDNNSDLIKKFNSLHTIFDESVFEGRFAWVDTIGQTELVDKLNNLSVADLELLTMLVHDEYSQSEIARIKGCSKMLFPKKSLELEKSLNKGLTKVHSQCLHSEGYFLSTQIVP